MAENKSLVERKRLRGRNSFEVANQLVNEYNSSNGWALVKVIPSMLSFEAILERPASHAEDVVDEKKVDEKESPEEDVVLEAEKAPAKPAAKKTTAKTSKKVTATSTDD